MFRSWRRSSSAACTGRGRTSSRPSTQQNYRTRSGAIQLYNINKVNKNMLWNCMQWILDAYRINCITHFINIYIEPFTNCTYQVQGFLGFIFSLNCLIKTSCVSCNLLNKMGCVQLMIAEEKFWTKTAVFILIYKWLSKTSAAFVSLCLYQTAKFLWISSLHWNQESKYT